MAGQRADSIRVLGKRLGGMMAEIEASIAQEDKPGTIPADMTFVEWLSSMKGSLKVDDRPWTLDDRPALLPIYNEIPTYRADCYQRILVIQKSTQIGLTTMSTLAQLYLARKFSPVNIASFVPDLAGAQFLSTHRWLPVVRSCPDIHRDLVSSGTSSEGSVMTRALRNPDGTTSLFRFLHTSGGMTTESFPASCTVLDEVQGMESADIDKVRARMGDSDMQFTLMLSTPNHSGLDINEWYLRGHQAVWHTRCPHCEALSDLSDPAGIFPDRSIVFNGGQIDGAPVDEYCWICPMCQQFIPDPQRGEYVSQNPSADPRIRSFLLPRTISPRITARDAIVGWNRAKGGDAKKSFYNRTLARPYVNVDELPVTLSLCEQCVDEGRLAGIEWQTGGSGCVAGIDNMGSHNVICVLKRHTDGRPALVYAEDIWDIEPYNRCSEIMDQFGVTCCVTESLPNYNSAMAFAHRHPGRVFTAGYGELRDQMLIWGDDPLNRSERHTDEGSRNRYTVVLNQYRCMMQALHRIKDRQVLFPDPAKLEQMVPDGDGGWKRTPILYDMFGDFARTALVVQEDPDTRKRRARVIKIGADPHHSYAWMCASVAWARVHGSTQWILPGEAAATREPEPIAVTVERCMPGLPKSILAMLSDGPISTCGKCLEFDGGAGVCCLTRLSGTAADPSCDFFERR